MRNKTLLRIGIAVALLAFTVAGLSRISFNIEILKLLPANLRQVEGLSLFLKNFALPNELIVTIESPDSDAAEAAADELAAHLTEHGDLVKRAVARPPWEKKPAELAAFLAYLVLNQPPDKVSEMLAGIAPDHTAATLHASLEKLTDSVSPQEIALLSYDPFGFGAPLAQSGLFSGEQQSEFASADGTFRVLYVESAKPLTNYKQTIAWTNEIKRVARDWSAGRAVTLGFTGEPGFVADISSTMEWDMASSGICTFIIVGAIFLLCYRRVKPLVQLQGVITIVFFLSLGAAGLFLRQLTVIGVGFASIMIGLSVDYGYFIYQKSLTHTGSVRDLQRICFQNIVWTAGTTAAAFFALNMSSLPGLSQLGNLVAIGVLVGAGVMLTVFVPLAVRLKKVEPRPSIIERWIASPSVMNAGACATLALFALLAGTLIFKGSPAVDFSARSLRPRHSDAYDALDRLQAKLIDDSDLLSLVVSGDTEAQVLDRLRAAEAKFEAAKARGLLMNFRTALPLWAVPENQRANLPRLAALASDAPRMKQAMLDAGFTEESFALTGAVLADWAASAAKPLPIWPANDTSQWIFRRMVRHENGQFLALGIVHPEPQKATQLAEEIEAPGVHLVSWNLLGSELQRVIPREFLHTFLALIGIVFFLLLIGFRGVRDVLLLALTMALVFVSLAGAMTLLGMSWNFFNLAAILLLLGTGIDYSILLILALRENRGDLADAQRQLGLVIALCAAAAAAGFGSISWANNLGLASLGKTCALGLVLDALISIFLLPRAWKLFHPRAAP